MKRLLLPLLLLAYACPFYGQVHRQSTVIHRGSATYAMVVPFASVRVCAAGTGSSTCGAVSIYSNYALTVPITGAVVADKSGNYSYYTATSCVDEVISSPGIASRVLPYVCDGGSGSGITLGTTNIPAGGTATSVAGLTVDGVTPTTFGYLDATSSIQTQLNAKAPLASPTFTGTLTTPITGSTQCLHVNSAGALSGTGSDCGSGGGGISGLTAHRIPVATSSTTIADSALTDDGTTLTYTGTGGITTTATVTTNYQNNLPGFNYGWPGVGPSTTNYSIAANLVNPIFFGQGISSGLTMTVDKGGNGDMNALLNGYGEYEGASTEGSGEGYTGVRDYLTLGKTPFTASVASTAAATGGLHLEFSSPSNASYGVGRIAIDTTDDVQATSVTSSSSVGGDQTTSGQYALLTISGTAVASTQGTLASEVDVASPSTSFTPTLVQLHVTTGSAWNAGDFFTVGGTFIESAHVLSTTTTPAAPADPTYAGGVATFYAEMRYSHLSGSIAFARGWTGRFLEQTAQTTAGTPPIRHLFYVLGATDTTHLAVAAQVQNGMSYEFLASTGSVNIFHGAPIVDARDPATGNTNYMGFTVAETDASFATSAGVEVPNGEHQATKMWAEQVGSNNPYAEVNHFEMSCLVGPTCGDLFAGRSLFDITNANPSTAYTLNGGTWDADDVFSITGPFASFAYFGADAPSVLFDLQNTTKHVVLFRGDDTQGYIDFVSGGATNTWHFDGYNFIFDAANGSGNTQLTVQGTLNLSTLGDGCLYLSGHAVTSTGAACGSGTGGMIYPGAGVPVSTGSGWGTSLAVGTAASNLVQLNGSAALPAVSGANLTSLNASNLASGTVSAGLLPTATSTNFGAVKVDGATITASAGVISAASSMVYPAAGLSVSTGTGWTTSKAAPTGAIVGTTDTQTLTNKTVDGVTPTTFGFLDATSSIQTQLNAKAPLASPTFSGTVTFPLMGSTQCLHVNSSGILSGTGSDCGSGGMVYPGAGIPVSTGSGWNTSVAAPSGAIVGTTDTQTLTNKTVDGVSPATMAFLDATSSVQTQLNGKVSGSGSSGQIAKFTGTTAVASSLLSDDGTTLTYSGSGGIKVSGSASPAIGSGTSANSDLTGELTFSSATTASYTFANSWSSHPECTVEAQFDPGSGNRHWVTYTGATSFTINFATAVTGTVTYVCMGRN